MGKALLFAGSLAHAGVAAITLFGLLFGDAHNACTDAPIAPQIAAVLVLWAVLAIAAFWACVDLLLGED